MAWREEFILAKSGGIVGIRLHCAGANPMLERIELHLDPEDLQVDALLVLKNTKTAAEQLSQQLTLQNLLPESLFAAAGMVPHNADARSPRHAYRAKFKNIATFFRNISDEQLADLNQVFAADAPELLSSAKERVLSGSRTSLTQMRDALATQPEHITLAAIGRQSGLRLDQILADPPADRLAVLGLQPAQQVDQHTANAPTPVTPQNEQNTTVDKQALENFYANLAKLDAKSLATIEKMYPKCPISNQLIFDPVRISIGVNTTYFERSHLEAWCEQGAHDKVHASGRVMAVIRHPTNALMNLEAFKSLITPAPEYAKLLTEIQEKLHQPQTPRSHSRRTPRKNS